jgi:hypothetical protein
MTMKAFHIVKKLVDRRECPVFEDDQILEEVEFIVIESVMVANSRKPFISNLFRTLW